MPKSGSPGALSRRTLAVGAAWSVPAIAAMAATPAFAASNDTAITGTGTACHTTGSNKTYRVTGIFTNTHTSSLTVTFIVTSTDGLTFATIPAVTIASNGTYTLNVASSNTISKGGAKLSLSIGVGTTSHIQSLSSSACK